MNEEYLKGLHGHLSIKDDYDTWVSSVKDNDEYLQGLHGHLGINDDYNTWKSSVWGGEAPVETEIPEVPKGGQAEVSGDSESTSADTEASSLESSKNKFHPFFAAQNPNLVEEAAGLQSIIDSKPIMGDNSKELKRLEEINAINDSFSKPNKSMRSVYNDQIREIDNRLFELEKKADALSKNSEFSFEEILKSDGTYQDLRDQKQRAVSYKEPYERVLTRIKEDTNSDQHDFLGKLGRVFGINAGNSQEADQTIDLNSKIEEQILASLDGDYRTLEKVANGYATLQEKEDIINRAKVAVIKREKQDILEQAKTVRESLSDDTVKAEKLKELDNRFNGLLGEVGYVQATGMLRNNFLKTDESHEFNELVSGDGFFHETGDAVSSLLEGIVQTGFKGTVGFTADMMSGLGDVATDQKGYSVFDAFADTVDQLGNFNYLPSSKAEDTRLVGEDGNLNLNYKTVSKSLAEVLPFTLAIVNDVKKGKIPNVEVALGRLLNPTKSAKVTNSLKLIDSAYRHTLSDNLNMADELGLDDNKGRVFANTLSLAEGMAELVMPDTRFFKTQAGGAILSTFKNDLKTATTKTAISNVVKNFTKNMALELGEEELVLATEDLLKFSMIVGHENSEFFDMRRQKELAAATVIMSGALGGANIKNDYQGNIREIYKEISDNINGVSESLQDELDSGHHSPEIQEEIKKSMEWANNMNVAIKKAPENVTGKQIDLLMQKQELFTEMKSVDDAFHPQYKAKIKAINAQINPINENQEESSATDTPVRVTTSNTEQEIQAEQGNVQAESEEEVGFREAKEKLQSIGVPNNVINALPKSTSITDTYRLGDNPKQIIGRLLTVAGVSETDTGKIQMNKLMKILNSKDSYNQTLFHEAVHSASVLATWSITEGRGRNLFTPQQRQSVHFLQSVLKELQSKVNPIVNQISVQNGGNLYGLKNIYEFQAEFMSNPKFRDWVSKNYGEVNSKSSLKSIWDSILRLVGIDNRKVDKDVVGDVYDAIGNVFQATELMNKDFKGEDIKKVKDEETEDNYKKLADNIRQLKINKSTKDALSNLQSNPIGGLFTGVWDGTLETVASAIEVTGNIDSAIRKGLSYVKNSNWYKNLSPEGKTKAIGIIEKDLRENLTPLAKNVVPKSKQTTKATIRKTTGQTDQSRKIKTTEAKILKEKFKNLEKGSKLGSKAMKQAKGEFIKEVSKSVRDAVNTNFLTKQEATRILSAVNQLDDKNYSKVKPLVDKVIAAAESKGLNRNIKSSKSKLKKAAKSKRTPLNIRQLAKGATNVDQRFLNDSDRTKYQKLLTQLENSLKASTSKNYKMANANKIEEDINELIEKSEKARTQSLVESVGLDGTTLTNKEIEELLEADNVDEYISNLKEAKTKDARLMLEKQASYAAIALNDVNEGNLSDSEKKAVRELKNADLTSLSSTDIRDFIKVVDNIALNENFSSSEKLISKIRANKAASKATSMFNKEDLNVIRKSTLTDLKSVALIFKKVFMSSKKSAQFNLLSGLNRLGMSYTRHKKSMNDLGKRYDKLFNSLKKKHKGILKPEATLLRGVAGQLVQGNTKEDFEINKSRVEDHISRLKENVTYDLRLGAEKVEIAYEQLKDLNSQEEVKDYMKDLKDGNWEIMDFWLKHFESVKDDLKYNTEVVHGNAFEEVSANYLPIKLKMDIKSLEKDNNEPAYNRRGLAESKPASSTISRTKSKKLPSDRILDLDFDSVMFNKASQVSIDIETSADYQDVYNFFDSSKMKEMFGREVIEVFNNKISEMRNVQLGVNSSGVSHDEITKSITKVERIWKTIATTTALGGLTQYVKQYPSVVTNVIPNLGKHGHLMFKNMFTNKSDWQVLDLASISLRGETQAGTITSGTRISQAEKKATKAAIGRISQELGLKADQVRNALFFSLRKGDVNVARSSWASFYQASLLDQGIKPSEIDMRTEHEKSDDPKRQQAISYAEIKVEETQISSDDSRGSEFYQSKSAYKSILRSMFLPFQSFNINAKMRMITDINILSSKRASTEQKLEATRSLLGTAGEVVTFHSIKYYMLVPLLGLGKSAIIELFDLNEPEEDEDSKNKFRFKQWYSALVKDLNPLSIGAFAEDMSIEILNYLQYLQDGEEGEQYIDYIKRKRDDGGQMFYRYKDKEERGKGFGATILNGGGLYAIPTNQYAEMSETFELASDGTKRDDYGNLNEYHFDENQKKFLKVAFAVEMLSLFGLGEADTRRIMRKIKKDVLRETPKTKIN